MQVQKDLWSEREFQSSFCMTLDGSQCLPPTSLNQLFDGTFAPFNPIFNDPGLNNIVAVLNTAKQIPQTNSLLEYCLGKDSSISPRKVHSSAIRGNVVVGFPLEGFKFSEELEEEQKDKVYDFLRGNFMKSADKVYEKGIKGVSFNYGSQDVITVYLDIAVQRDMLLIIGSIVFIFLFMWFQTRSFFITSMAMASILNGFVITDLIYVTMLEMQYLGPFHVLSLFIVLGIGADDVFVFLDTWKETEHLVFPSDEHRMSFTFKRAGMAMLYTSVTTAIAFFVSSVSPLLAVMSFGVFSGILVMVNYASVVMFLPTVVAFHYFFLEKANYCGRCKCYKQKEVGGKNVIVAFFAGPYFNFITHKFWRWVILLVFFSFIGVMIFYSVRVKEENEQVRLSGVLT